MNNNFKISIYSICIMGIFNLFSSIYVFGQKSNWTVSDIDGFTALPGGARYYNGELDVIGYNGCWWSSTEYETDYAWLMSLSNLTRDVGRSYSDKAFGLSVRCIKD